ncbi:helix-turn-helix domain-containing protein [Enterobacter cloacae]|uniref:helix-turn-helix domain-containing protein n=1 Tax=Enterobacter cloacae TaxID=550 RepID=UPI002004676D|nr:helix-turn-helix transcriptional regulator [Enterobacter cloacae]MCK7386502.1 helix-turn-helix transcriptional regulator [Enterobacter cloacae]
MNESSRRLTNFTSILLLIIKEIRLEKSMHQAQLAERINKTPSALAKIETGKSPLSMEVFLAYCANLSVSPSAVMATAERYASLLNNNGWTLLNSALEENDDELLKEAQEYYASSAYKNRISIFQSALNGPTYYPNGNVDGLAVFLFAISPQYKAQQLAQPLLSGR